MAIDKGLLFLTMVWSLTILVIALVGTIAFATAQWITAGEVESASFNLKEISLGMVHSCYTLISDDQIICGRYGNSLEDIPHAAWRAGAFFFGIGVLMMWLVWLASLFTCIYHSVQRTLRHFMAASTTFLLIGLFSFLGGLAQTNPDASAGADYAAPCTDAAAFYVGACSFDFSGILGCLTLVLAIMATFFGFILKSPKIEDTYA